VCATPAPAGEVARAAVVQAFSSDTRRWLPSLRLHREGLKKVVRRDTHDRADTWYVRPDGSNLEECLEDALQATREEGLPGSSRHAKSAARRRRMQAAFEVRREGGRTALSRPRAPLYSG
jgi:hypothetical protein